LLPSTLRDEVEHARLFSLAMHGAALLYNLLMAERAVDLGIRDDDEGVERFRQAAASWAAEAGADSSLAAWSLSEFWATLSRVNPHVPHGARRFAERWIAAAKTDPAAAIESYDLRQLITTRERSLKGSLARLTNRRPLERWNGASGLGRLTYRWREARTVTADIRAGLRSHA
jgi:hypothetical protein